MSIYNFMKTKYIRKISDSKPGMTNKVRQQDSLSWIRVQTAPDKVESKCPLSEGRVELFQTGELPDVLSGLEGTVSGQ